MRRRTYRGKPKTRHYRCRRCGTPIPCGYVICAGCGENQATQIVRVDTLEELTREYNSARYGIG